jgi:dolichyl-phosphate-mannose-protein mannosyltransferase
VAACVVLLGAYIAVIMLLQTETARRSTAPPWYSWLRLPPTRTRWQSALLALPAVAFAGWAGVVRRLIARPFPQALALLSAFVFVFAINVTTAMMDGSAKAIWKPFDWPGSEYFSDVPAVRGVGQFLHGYVQNLYHYSIHSRTHPPGAVLVLYFVGRALGPGIGTAAWSAVFITATGVAPFYLLARRLAGRQTASIALALYATAPSLVLFGATSMDGVFLVAMLWSTYFLHRAIVEPGTGISIVAGFVVAASLMLSYVTVCVGVMTFIYAILELAVSPKRIGRVAGSFAICAMVIFLCLAILYGLTGFNYLACFRASRFYDHYAMKTFSISFFRYVDVSFSNLIAFLIGVGFPVIVLWWKQTIRSVIGRTPADRFNMAGVASVLIFSFAGLFTHETERIWLFFVPVGLLAAASWIGRAGGKGFALRGSIERRLLEWTMSLTFMQTWLMQLLLFTIW